MHFLLWRLTSELRSKTHLVDLLLFLAGVGGGNEPPSKAMISRQDYWTKFLDDTTLTNQQGARARISI